VRGARLVVFIFLSKNNNEGVICYTGYFFQNNGNAGTGEKGTACGVGKKPGKSEVEG